MIKLKDILKEDEVNDKFGDVALGGDPNIARMQGKKQEDNTEFEEKLYDILNTWTFETSIGLANKLYNNFALLKKAAKKFPKVFLPSTSDGTILYRGIRNLNKQLRDKLEKTKQEDWKKVTIGDKIMYQYSKPVKYTPRLKVQSWTSSAKVATFFSKPREWSVDSISVILSTTQNNEFLFNQNLIRYIFSDTLSSEKEILHFGQTFKEKVYISISRNFWEDLPSKGKKK